MMLLSSGLPEMGALMFHRRIEPDAVPAAKKRARWPGKLAGEAGFSSWEDGVTTGEDDAVD